MTTSLDLSPARRKAIRATRKRTRIWVRSLAGLGVLLTIGTGIGSAALGREDGTVLEDLDAVSLRIEELTSQKDSLATVVRSENASLRLIREIGSHPDWSHLLLLLADLTGERLTLDSVDLTLADRTWAGDVPPPNVAGNGPFALILQGRAKDQEDVTEFVLALETTGVFQRVNLVESMRSSDSTAAFRVECVLGRAATEQGGAK